MPVFHETCRSKKRPRPAPDPLPYEIGPDLKRRKSLPEPEGYCTHRPPRIWDTLSKVRLSRGGPVGVRLTLRSVLRSYETLSRSR